MGAQAFAPVCAASAIRSRLGVLRESGSRRQTTSGSSALAWEVGQARRPSRRVAIHLPRVGVLSLLRRSFTCAVDWAQGDGDSCAIRWHARRNRWWHRRRTRLLLPPGLNLAAAYADRTVISRCCRATVSSATRDLPLLLLGRVSARLLSLPCDRRTSRPFGSLVAMQLHAWHLRVLRGRRHPAHPRPRPHPRRRGGPRLARPSCLVTEALARHADRDVARVRRCRRCSRSRAGRSPRARAPGPSTCARSRRSWTRSRRRSTTAASRCMASTTRTAGRSPRGSVVALRPPRVPRRTRRPTARPRRTRPRRPRMPRRSPRSSCPGRWASRSGGSTCASRPGSGRSPRSPSPSTRCRSARPGCSPGTMACRSPGRRPAIRSPSPRTACSSTTRATTGTWSPGCAQVFEVVFGGSADAMWQEAASLLDPRGGDLRSWLASGFFEHHLKRHSKSRRKAPILWQLGVPSGRYSRLGLCPPDGPGQPARHRQRAGRPPGRPRGAAAVEPARQGGANPGPKERAEIAAAETFLDELRTFADEVRRVAPLWAPDLDDGIVLVMAPLWRLVPGHRAWQKELRTKWDELCAGKYDWAHLSMHLWPERVVPKCADRPEPRDRPRPGGRLLGRGRRRQVDQACPSHPVDRGPGHRARRAPRSRPRWRTCSRHRHPWLVVAGGGGRHEGRVPAGASRNGRSEGAVPGGRLTPTEASLARRWDQPSSYEYPTLRSVSLGGEAGIRGCRNLRLDFRYPLTVLIGRNGTGKSTLLALAALALVTDAARTGRDVHALRCRRCFR